MANRVCFPPNLIDVERRPRNRERKRARSDSGVIGTVTLAVYRWLGLLSRSAEMARAGVSRSPPHPEAYGQLGG